MVELKRYEIATLLSVARNDNLAAGVRPEEHRLAHADSPLQVLDSSPDHVFRLRCRFSHFHRASVCAIVSHPSWAPGGLGRRALTLWSVATTNARFHVSTGSV